MKRFLLALTVLVIGGGDAWAAAPAWSADSLAKLRLWAAAAPADALPSVDEAPLKRALAASDPVAVDAAASALALKLARMHLLGSAAASERKGWHIADPDGQIDLAARLQSALAEGRLDEFFMALRPQHPDYALLRAAYRDEADPLRRQTIARNMERWRWLPVSLGQDFLLVNAAAFEAARWRGGQRIGSWRVIVGKPATPTPVFAATVTGVNFNPWWTVPGNIIRESVGSLIRRHPATARARGYVWGGGAVRQKPGPQNALGQVKLVMPNGFSVYLHDTPNRELFDRPVRAFSHGCVRVGDALGLAASLLEGAQSRTQIDALVAAGQSVTVDLPRPIPVYVAYFTAGSRADGSLALFDDLYRRDRALPALAQAGRKG
ncbi:MAG: hypothetical protein RL339_2111, partial [Pseudomonadota bacterium]